MITKKDKTLHVLKIIIDWLLTLFVLVPLYILFINALKGDNESVSLQLPKIFMWSNFTKVWNMGIMYKGDWGAVLLGYKNSLILTISTVLFSLLFAAPASFVLSRRKSKLNKMIYAYFSLGLMVPVNMVAVVKVEKWFKLFDTRLGAILILTAFVLPFSVMLYYGFVRGIPKELDEAGFLDGANAYVLFFKIIFPLLTPVTVTVVMINFLNVWNDYGVSLYTLFNPNNQVILQVMLRFMGTGQYASKWNCIFVAVIFGILPIFLVYILGQKYIISGMTSGAVKG